MKFGKDLEQYKSAGWQDDYIDYKGLKVILKKLEEEGADREEVDAEFFQSLEDELEKVNKAFLERCAEVEAALEVATRRMSRSSSSAGLAKEAEAGVSELTLEQKRQSLEERLEAQKQSERIYFDAYRTLGRLQTFVWINTKGFQKIMKKYDKRLELRGTGQELGPDFEKRLEKEAFCSGKLEVLLHLFKSRKPEGVSLSTATKRDGGGAARPHLQLLAGNANPELAEEISARLGVPLTPAKISRFADGEVSIQILENVRRATRRAIPRAIPRAIRRNDWRNSLTAHPSIVSAGAQLGRLHHPAVVAARQRQPDGAAALRLRRPPRRRRARHRRRAVLRLRAPGPQGAEPRADLGGRRGEDDGGDGRRPRLLRRPALRPDPGLLRPAHARRQPVRHADRAGVLPDARARQLRDRLARRRRRRAREDVQGRPRGARATRRAIRRNFRRAIRRNSI